MDDKKCDKCGKKFKTLNGLIYHIANNSCRDISELCEECDICGLKYKPELSNVSNFQISNNISNTHSLGQILYTDYIHIFQVSGMILLIAMIGAIVLTFRQREGVKKQSYLKQISRERTEGVEVLEVAFNKGVKIDD